MRDSQNLKSITAINEKIKMNEKNLEEIHSKAYPKKTQGVQQNSTNKQRTAHTSNYSDIHNIKSGPSYSKKDNSKLVISQLDDSSSPTKFDKTKMVLGNSNIEILENNSLGKQNFFGQTLSQKSSLTDHMANMTNHSRSLYGSVYGGKNNRENQAAEYSKVNGKLQSNNENFGFCANEKLLPKLVSEEEENKCEEIVVSSNGFSGEGNSQMRALGKGKAKDSAKVESSVKNLISRRKFNSDFLLMNKSKLK